MTSRHLTDVEIQQYLDGSLAKDNPLYEHLQDCPDCRLQVSLYRGIATVIEQNLSIQTDIRLPEIIMSRIREEREKALERRQKSVLYGLIAGAALCILLFFGSGLLKSLAGIIKLFGLLQYARIYAFLVFTGTILLFLQILDAKWGYYQKNAQDLLDGLQQKSRRQI